MDLAEPPVAVVVDLVVDLAEPPVAVVVDLVVDLAEPPVDCYCRVDRLAIAMSISLRHQSYKLSLFRLQ